MNRIAYFTVKIPFGSGEAFILTEICALKKLGADILIIPRDSLSGIFHQEATSLVEHTLSIPWINIEIVKAFLIFIATKPALFFKITADITLRARKVKIALKNVLIFPKSIYLTAIIKERSVTHIHAHWGTTPATMAYIVHRITNIPWSLTLHRWDILEDNILRCKCRTASFVRCISQEGQRESLEVVDDDSLNGKFTVIPMGVEIPPITGSTRLPKDFFTFLCPANLLPVKGHRYLFEGCKALAEQGEEFRCVVAGDGPLEKELRAMVDDFRLKEYVKFAGRLPQDKLFDWYAKGKVDAVILPSILTGDGEKEGIPVALMEAMSYGIPVISTDTGAVSELTGDDHGILIPPQDSEAVARTMKKLMKDPDYCRLIGKQGRKKIEKEFRITDIAYKLLESFAEV